MKQLLSSRRSSRSLPRQARVEGLERRQLMSVAAASTAALHHQQPAGDLLARAARHGTNGRSENAGYHGTDHGQGRHKKHPKIIIDPVYAASFATADREADPIAYTGPILPTTPGTTSTIEGLNFDTQASTSGFYSVPPDNSAAAGPNHVINVINTDIQWFTKAGVLQNTQRLGKNSSTAVGSFFAPLNPTTGTFDAKVLYDTYNSRFVVVTLEKVDTGVAASNVSRVLLAVSQTSDPNGGWFYTAINSNLVISGHSTWLDYPGFAVDANAIYVTGNMFAMQSDSTPGAFEGSRMVIVNKTGFYAGGAPASAIFYDPSTLSGAVQNFTLQPAVMYGTTPGSTGTFLVSSGLTSGATDFLSVIRVDNPVAAPTFVNTYISLGDVHDGTTAAFISAVPEKGTANTLDGGDQRTLSAVWRNNTLWAVNDINPTAAYDSTNFGQETAHWYRISTLNLASLSLSDQGDVGGEDVAAADWTFYPSIAVDSAGNMAIDFSVSGTNTFPSAAYTVHATADAASTVENAVVFAAGTDYYFRKFGAANRNRWGDYSGLSIDPAGTSFWAFNQYAITRGTVLGSYPTEDGRYGTRYASFSISATGTITGTLFQDNNADGVVNGTDTGFVGQTAYLDVNNNSTFDGGDIGVTTTAGGVFTFSNVPVGTYTLREVVPTGFVQANAGSGYTVVVTSGANLTGYTFGNFPISYTGTVGNDTYTVQLVGGIFQLTANASVFTAPFSLLNASVISLSLLAGDDVLNVNSSGGNPVPANGITLDGGAQTLADTLNVIGSAATYSFTANATQVLFGSSPINFSNTETVNIDPKTGLDSLVVNAGVVHLSGQTGSGLLVDHFSTLNIASGASLLMNNSNSGFRTDKTVLIANVLGLDPAGKLDLNSNDAIIHNAIGYSTITGFLKSGFAGGNWNGVGMDSSAANADPKHISAIGAEVNSTGANFDSQTGLLTTDILLKYTYYGDGNLDGVVDGSDYTLIDAAFGTPTTGWQNGDFNFDNLIDGSDYTLIDNAFNTQGAAL